MQWVTLAEMDAQTLTAIGACVAVILAAVGVLIVKVLPIVTESLGARSKRALAEREADARLSREFFQPSLDAMNGIITAQESRIVMLEDDRLRQRDSMHAERVALMQKIQELVDANTDCERRVAVLTSRLENVEHAVHRQSRSKGPQK